MRNTEEYDDAHFFVDACARTVCQRLVFLITRAKEDATTATEEAAACSPPASLRLSYNSLPPCTAAARKTDAAPHDQLFLCPLTGWTCFVVTEIPDHVVRKWARDGRTTRDLRGPAGEASRRASKEVVRRLQFDHGLYCCTDPTLKGIRLGGGGAANTTTEEEPAMIVVRLTLDLSPDFCPPLLADMLKVAVLDKEDRCAERVAGQLLLAKKGEKNATPDPATTTIAITLHERPTFVRSPRFADLVLRHYNHLSAASERAYRTIGGRPAVRSLRAQEHGTTESLSAIWKGCLEATWIFGPCFVLLISPLLVPVASYDAIKQWWTLNMTTYTLSFAD